MEVPWIRHEKTFSAHLNSFFKGSHFDTCTRDLGVYPGVVVEVIFASICCSIGIGLQKSCSRLGELHAGHVSQIC